MQLRVPVPLQEQQAFTLIYFSVTVRVRAEGEDRLLRGNLLEKD